MEKYDKSLKTQDTNSLTDKKKTELQNKLKFANLKDKKERGNKGILEFNEDKGFEA